MTGPKQKLSPEKYAIWLEQHKSAEMARRQRIRDSAHPIVKLPLDARARLDNAYELEAMYWHPLACECGSCQSVVGPTIKEVRMSERPIPPAVKALVSPLPPLSDQTLQRLRAVEAQALSTLADPSTQQ